MFNLLNRIIQGPVLRVFHGGAGGAVWQESQGLPGRREPDRAPDAVPARAPPVTRRGRAAAQSWYVQVKICTVSVFYLYVLNSLYP